MKQTSQILKEAREKKGVSLSEVSMATKISAKVLEAMEQGDLDSLPSKAFLKGFIQTYANYLKLDSKNIMQTFNEEMGFGEQKTRVTENANENSTEGATNAAPTKSSMPRPIDDNSSNMSQKIAIGFGVVVIMLVIKLLFQTIEKYERESKAPTQTEIESTIKRGSSDSEQQAVPATAPTPAPEQISPPPLPIPIPSTAAKPAVETKATTAEPPPPAAPKAETKPPVPAAKPTEVAKEVKPPANTIPKSDAKSALLSETGASIQNKELIIEALDNVEIVFSVDGAPSKKARLDTDKIHIIKASTGIKLEVSDGGAVNIIFNGQDMGVPGAVGKPMQLSYP